MKIKNLILPAIALGSAVVLTTPRESHGFALLGHSLSVSETGFRVHNNFLDATANNNTTADANFPGAQGAVMAIWKAVIEWASEKHGDGTGDPHQPTGLGSGNSNFDPFYIGEATGVGSIGNNIHSALDLDGGGTFAFMQGGGGGWWIRYYENWTWDDGPGTSISNRVDIQGIAVHEHGHALGLGHSGVGGATMVGGTSPGSASVSNRSIASDDQAGIQAIYGHKSDSGTKPVITNVINLGGQAHIFGSNFTANNNEVWFTRESASSPFSGNSAIEVTGVSTVGGGTTEIIVNIPAAAGPGDIMVKRNSSGQASTSNPWPFDPDSVTPPVPMITSITPSQVTVIQADAPSTITIMGSGLNSTSQVVFNGDVVGVGSGFHDGSFTVVSDNQVDVVLPLTATAGTANVELTTAGGLVSDQIEIVPPAPSTGFLYMQPEGNILSTEPWSIAVTSNDLDLDILYVSPVLGPTVAPGAFTLEIGDNGPAFFYILVKVWTLGPKLWREEVIGPIGSDILDPGTPLHFEALVAPPGPMSDYAFPWGSTNVVSRVVTM